MFRRNNIDSILRTFDRVASQLESHLDNKVTELFSLNSVKHEVETQIEANAAEIDRAERVLTKVKELIV